MGFVPPFFAAPRHLLAGPFRLQPLGPELAEEDYPVVMANRERLSRLFDRQDDWPDPALSFEDNYRDLLWHAREFSELRSFAYAVRGSVGGDYLGCVACTSIRLGRRTSTARCFSGCGPKPAPWSRSCTGNSATG